MPNRKTVVKTNSTPNSVKEVHLNVLTFRELWDNYATGNPYDDPDGQHGNQCAIRMSVTFHRVGIEMKSFSQKVVKPAPGRASIGRILLGGKATATRADELAEWLKLRPIAGLRPAENITGPDWSSRVKDRTGIIAFLRYWSRERENPEDASGSHIDLWNGSRLTISSPANSFATMGRMLGMDSFFAEYPFGFSDLGQSKQILFWEMK
ncbi:type VI secretion system amidase effector protein Tae4 [Paraburkholderia acidicola]|uniref:Type VI secretion system amidase effector protein Tae4 n=1 Tax=Paraburkholderia acidicola TaxID=1912599 RepID=A0ABV1LUR8_9BURK